MMSYYDIFKKIQTSMKMSSLRYDERFFGFFHKSVKLVHFLRNEQNEISSSLAILLSMKSNIAHALVGFLSVPTFLVMVPVSLTFFRKYDIPGFVTWWPSDVGRFTI